MTSLVCMAEIVGAHGVKGMVKLKTFSDDPQGLPDYGAFCDASGKISLTLQNVVAHGSIWLAELEGVDDRTAAEKLRGTKLYLERTRLPAIKKKDTFYHADLMNMTALHADGKVMGKVLTVANFGAGDLLEIKPVKGASFYVPFTDAVVPEVNVETKTVTVVPPKGLLD